MEEVTKLILLLAMARYIRPTYGVTDDIPWHKARTLLHTLCPEAHICETNSIYTGIRTGCCESCSCNANCTTTYKCCYLQNSVTDDETCMFLRSKSTKTNVESALGMLLYSYYVVTKSPIDGCVDGRFAGDCNENNTSLLAPVLSTEREKIYFNRACAACHGVTKVIQWDSAVICDDLGSSASIDFDKEMTAFLNNESSSLCFLVYYLHSYDVVANRRCLIDQFQAENDMSDNSEITFSESADSILNMSMKDIRDACRSKLYAPVLSESSSKRRWYQNPFCFVYRERTTQTANCLMMPTNHLPVKYMTLLNPEVNDILRSSKGYQNTDSVCFKTDSAIARIERKTCRPVMCPKGHVRNLNGTCIFIGIVYTYGKVSIDVYIILERTGSGLLNGSRNIKKDQLSKALNLTMFWKLLLVATSMKMPSDKKTTKDKLLVVIRSVSKDLRTALKSMKVQLEHDVHVQEDELNVTYTQYILPQSLVILEVTKTNLPSILCEKQRSLKSNGAPKYNYTACWKSVYTNIALGYSSVEITKLYFCSIIELIPDEFVLLANDSVLFYVLRNVYLYDKEFMVVKNDNGNKSVKICMEGSGFVPSAGNSSDTSVEFQFILYILIIVVSVYC